MVIDGVEPLSLALAGAFREQKYINGEKKYYTFSDLLL